MASDASPGSAKTDEIAAGAQQGGQPKIPPNPFSCIPPHHIIAENHLPPHLQQLLCGQDQETFLPHFPSAAMHMLAWEWPPTLDYAAASCSMNTETYDGAYGQGSSQGIVPPIFEYVNQLGARLNQSDPRYSEQAFQHQCQYPHQFLRMAQGSMVHDVYTQTRTYCKDEQSKFPCQHRSEFPPHLINRSQTLYPHSVPKNYLPNASIFQPGVASLFAGKPSCDESGMRALNTLLLSTNVNVQLHKGDVGEEKCTRETQKFPTGSEQTQFNCSPRTHYAVTPTQRLFLTPKLGWPLHLPEDHCFDERLQQHYPDVASSSFTSPMACLVNRNPIDTADHGAAQCTGLQPVAGLWDQIGKYPPRCFQQAPALAPAPSQIISTPFPLSSTSSTLPNLFKPLEDSSSSTSFLNSGSASQLSACSAFNCTPSYDSHILLPNHTLNNIDCLNQYSKPAFAITTQVVASDKISDSEPVCHSSNTKISSLLSVAALRQEQSEICQGSSSEMKSHLAENVISVHDTVSKELPDCRLQRHKQVRTRQPSTRWPSESAGVVYSYQGSSYGDGRRSSSAFCNLLGQDKHVLMRRNGQYAIARDPFKIEVSAHGLCAHEALDFVPPSGIHDVQIVPVGRTSSMHRQSGVKGQWGAAEDRVLSKLVKRYGSRRWSLISTFMASRSGKQCRERWVNHLQPDIRKEGWTTAEEELLVHAHSTFGNRWSAIAKSLPGDRRRFFTAYAILINGNKKTIHMLPGRTDNSIKNHWHAALRKKDRHGQLRPSLLREYIQKQTFVRDSTTKTFGKLPTPMLNEAEVNDNDACLSDSTRDKEDAKQSMQVDDTSSINDRKDTVHMEAMQCKKLHC